MQSLEKNGFTAEQLLALPRGQSRHELVRGELRTMSPAGWLHGAVAARIARILGNHVEAHQLGVVFAAETGCFLERRPDTVRAADVSFVSKERMAAMARQPGYLPGAPDLAIEVLSPSDTGPEVRVKVAMWLQHGCRLVWVIDPDRQRGEMHRPGEPPVALGEDGVFTGADVLPGFALPLCEALSF
jgi:Uma2 family endonuclease